MHASLKALLVAPQLHKLSTRRSLAVLQEASSLSRTRHIRI
jgi:hypothetical protein